MEAARKCVMKTQNRLYKIHERRKGLGRKVPILWVKQRFFQLELVCKSTNLLGFLLLTAEGGFQ